jgi:hypothetical protein
MAYTPIDKSDDYFNVLLYTGTGSNLTLSGMDFQADWVWVKRRNASAGHKTADVVRGFGASGKVLSQQSTSAEGTQDLIESFTSNGYVVGTDSSDFNTSGGTYVTWNWLAGGTASSNTAGLITSTVSANTTAGFSVVGYTGTGNSNNTVGHGLTQPLDFLIIKNRDRTSGWKIGSSQFSGWNYVMGFDTGGQSLNTNPFNSTAPTSSVFTIKNGSYADTNQAGEDFIAYCFHSVKGFSKIGKYIGNGSTDGTFVYTGFKPAWVMIKNIGTSNWTMHDNKRNPYNQVTDRLYANLSNAEDVGGPYGVDFLSNGMKMRTTESTSWNGNGVTFIYMAFAENPFVTSTGIPACAR